MKKIMLFWALSLCAAFTVSGASAGLKAKYVKKKDGHYVRLQWRKSSRAKGWYLYDDESRKGELTRGARELLTGTSYDVKIRGWAGRDYQFELEPIDKKNKAGRRLKLSFYMPHIKLPRVNKLKVLFDYTTGDLNLTWSYPSVKKLKGFRLYMNGKLFKNTDQISAITRSIAISDYSDSKKNLAFQLRAVNEITTSDSVKSYFNTSRIKVDRKLTAPMYLVTLYEKKNGKRFVRVSWKKMDLKKEALKGFGIRVKHESYGKGEFQDIIPRNKLCTGKDFWWPLPTSIKSGRIYIRLYSVGLNNKESLYKESDTGLFPVNF